MSAVEVPRPVHISGSIVAYNSDPAQLVSAATSFLSGSLTLRLIVIDNSPCDKLRHEITSTGAEYYFTGRNVGFGAAHNLAIRKNLGASDYHLILNPDVTFGPDLLATLYGFMQRNSDVGLVMPRVLYPDGREQQLCKLLPTPFDLLARRFGGPVAYKLFRAKMDRYLLKHADLRTPSMVPCLSGCCMLVRTSLLQTVGLFDERYFLYMEDFDLCRRIGEVAKTVYFPSASVYHGYQRGSYSNPVLMKYHLQSAWKYFCKWGWFIDRTRDQLNARVGSLGMPQAVNIAPKSG